MARSLLRFDRDVVFKTVLEGARLLFEDFDTPRSLSCYLLAKYREWDQLVSLETRPSDYMSAASYFDDAIVTSFFRKSDFLPTSFDRRQRAFEKWVAAERRCSETNDRIRTTFHGGSLPPRVASMIFTMQRKIAKVLGYVPSVEDLSPRFGPGATSSCRGSSVTIADKLSARPGVTAELLHLVPDILGDSPRWVESITGADDMGDVSTVQVDIEKGNRLLFVPKDAKVDRPICVEPHLNSYLQLGYGRWIRDRMARHGLDLDTMGTDVNPHLARLGSVDGSYATIDLASASDTISYMLVLELLPQEWFEALDVCRSHRTLLPNGACWTNQKFSSMGNGFTFELESLIFWAAAYAACQEVGSELPCFSFGDDITVPSEAASTLIDLLAVLGFEVNAAKSFTAGPFRESCGKDFFDGVPVRPLFIKEVPEYLHEVYSLLNGVRRLAISRDGRFSDRRFRRCWRVILSLIPRNWRFFGPDVGDDSVIISPRSEAPIGLLEVRGWIGTVRSLNVRGLSRSLDRYKPQTQHAVALYNAGSQTTLSVRKRISSYRVRRRPICSWSWWAGEWG